MKMETTDEVLLLLFFRSTTVFTSLPSSPGGPSPGQQFDFFRKG